MAGRRGRDRRPAGKTGGARPLPGGGKTRAVRQHDRRGQSAAGRLPATQAGREPFRIIGDLRATGVAIQLVEQNARAAVQIADPGYVLETGSMVSSAPSHTLANDPRIITTYLGLNRAAPAPAADAMGLGSINPP